MATLHTPLCDLLGIEYPIIQAPMAGGPTTPDLVAAVSAAGALGSFGHAYTAPDAMRADAAAVRTHTARPFNSNLFTAPVPAEAPADVQRAKVELLGIEQLADFVLISGEFGVWKPDPGIFVEALRLGGTAAEDAIFIGDSAEHDIAGARALAIRTIWVNRTGQPWTHDEPPPDLEVASLTALLPLLR